MQFCKQRVYIILLTIKNYQQVFSNSNIDINSNVLMILNKTFKRHTKTNGEAILKE